MDKKAQKAKSTKFLPKLTVDAKEYIIKRLSEIQFEEKTQEHISQEVLSIFKVKVDNSRISQIKSENKEIIREKQAEFNEAVIFSNPIANKAWRLKEWYKLYNDAQHATGYTKDGDPYEYKDFKAMASALRGAESELGENFEKYMEALIKSGGNNVIQQFNIGTNEDADRLIRECATVLGFKSPTSRF